MCPKIEVSASPGPPLGRISRWRPREVRARSWNPGPVFPATWRLSLILNAKWKPMSVVGRTQAGLAYILGGPLQCWGWTDAGQECPQQLPAHIQVLVLWLGFHWTYRLFWRELISWQRWAFQFMNTVCLSIYLVLVWLLLSMFCKCEHRILAWILLNISLCFWCYCNVLALFVDSLGFPI